MTAAEPKTLETKRCRYCCQRLPLKQFRRYRADREARRPECNGCHLERENERQRKSRRKTNGMVIKKYVSEIARTRSLVRFVGIVEALAERFGGADGLADEWYATFQKAQKEKRHRRATDMMIAGFDLMRAADEASRQLQKEELAIADDEAVLATAIQAQPGESAAVLRRLGWVVERPSVPSD